MAKKNLLMIFLMALGTATILSFIVPNGDISCKQGLCGLHIGDWHFHDSLWHVALSQVAFLTTPFQNPAFAGAPLQNYNYLLDIGIYLISKLGIPPLFTYFKLLPVVIMILYGVAAIYYACQQTTKTAYRAAIIFFLYFGASTTYLVTLFHKEVGSSIMAGFPVALSIQSGTMFLNLQFAATLAIFLYMLTLFKKEISLKNSVILGLLLFICTGLKFYGGILMIGMLLFYEFLHFLETKNIKVALRNSLIYLVFFGACILAFYDPFISSVKPGPLFVFAPFAILHRLIEEKYLFYSQNMVLARYYLYEQGLSPRLILIEAYSLVLFMVLNFGSRLLALIYIIKKIITRTLSKEELVVLAAIIVGTLMPIFFIQKTGWFNTMQFLYYSVFLMNFFAAKFLYDLLKSHKKIVVALGVVMILLTIPNNIEQWRYVNLPQQVISEDELEALSFLKEKPDAVVFTLPLVAASPYFSALSGKVTYYSDTSVLDLTNVRYQERLSLLSKPYNLDVTKLPVGYYYLLKMDSNFDLYYSKLKQNKKYIKIFENKSIIIYQRGAVATT